MHLLCLRLKCYAQRFLRRLWKLVYEHLQQGQEAAAVSPDALNAGQRALRRKLHQTLAKVTDDMSRRFTFNTAIAAIMELLNEMTRLDDDSAEGRAVTREVLEAVVLMLSPIVPHVCHRLWRELGIDRIRLEINSLGEPESRARYRNALVEYFTGVKSQLDEDSIRRLDTNPLRILDSKNPEMQDLVQAAPVMLDYLDEASAAHFAELQDLLGAAGVEFEVNPRLVRGLDYYSRTVFEWVTDALGSQGAVCSGGRYDGLVEKLGGRATPAICWAMGIERFVALYEACGGEAPPARPDVYLVAVGKGTQARAFALAEELRDNVAGIAVEMNLDGFEWGPSLFRVPGKLPMSFRVRT